MARPSKLTKTMHDAIVEAICDGNFAVIAAKANGITEQTYYNWLAWGERDLDAGKASNYSRFFESIKTAEAEAELAMVRAMPTDDKWQRRAWWLERRFPKRWGQRAAVEVSGPEGKPIEVNARHELEALLDRRKEAIEEATKALADG